MKINPALQCKNLLEKCMYFKYSTSEEKNNRAGVGGEFYEKN